MPAPHHGPALPVLPSVLPRAETPADRPASDPQLLRLGQLLGLRYGEAEALIEALAETPRPAEPAPPPRWRTLRRRLQGLSPQLLEALQAVPGVFLLTDGVTPARMARARERTEGLLGGARRLAHLTRWAEAAAEQEAGLLLRAGEALGTAAQRGLLPEACAGLRDLLRPLVAGSRARARRRAPR